MASDGSSVNGSLTIGHRRSRAVAGAGWARRLGSRPSGVGRRGASPAAMRAVCAARLADLYRRAGTRATAPARALAGPDLRARVRRRRREIEAHARNASGAGRSRGYARTCSPDVSGGTGLHAPDLLSVSVAGREPLRRTTTDAPAGAARRAGGGWSARPGRWTLFFRRDDRTTWCAVPVGSPIPRFLTMGAWLYATQCGGGTIAPRFRPEVADLAGSRTGFYFFRNFAWDVPGRSGAVDGNARPP